jgi:folate-dependent phosphoribosylglycinamide formyltransferase PurN
MMRILICSKRDLTSVVFLNDLLERLADLRGITVSLLLAERTRRIETVVPELMKMKALERDLPFGVLFPLIEGRATGTPAAARALTEIFGVEALCGALAAPPPAGARPLLTPDRLVAHHGVPCRVVRDFSGPDALAAVAGFAPDVILSARFSFRFPPAILAEARLVALNVHPGRLPDYAGLYPHFYAMMAGERNISCTVHVMDDRIDSGPILASRDLPLVPGRSAFRNNLESHLLGNRLVAEIVDRLAAGELPPGKAAATPAAQHTYPTPDQFRAFRMAGLSLIDAREYVDILRRLGFAGGLPGLPDPQQAASRDVPVKMQVDAARVTE